MMKDGDVEASVPLHVMNMCRQVRNAAVDAAMAYSSNVRVNWLIALALMVLERDHRSGGHRRARWAENLGTGRRDGFDSEMWNVSINESIHELMVDMSAQHYVLKESAGRLVIGVPGWGEAFVPILNDTEGRGQWVRALARVIRQRASA